MSTPRRPWAGYRSTPTSFDFVSCAAYKWLLSPRGTAFGVVQPERLGTLRPLYAGWYAGDDPWTAIYGPPLRLARDARRLDISPAWLSWSGTVPALELLPRMSASPRSTGTTSPSPTRYVTGSACRPAIPRSSPWPLKARRNTLGSGHQGLRPRRCACGCRSICTTLRPMSTPWLAHSAADRALPTAPAARLVGQQRADRCPARALVWSGRRGERSRLLSFHSIALTTASSGVTCCRPRLVDVALPADGPDRGANRVRSRAVSSASQASALRGSAVRLNKQCHVRYGVPTTSRKARGAARRRPVRPHQWRRPESGRAKRAEQQGHAELVHEWPFADVAALFITHHHYDHIGELADFAPQAPRARRTPGDHDLAGSTVAASASSRESACGAAWWRHGGSAPCTTIRCGRGSTATATAARPPAWGRIRADTAPGHGVKHVVVSHQRRWVPR